jgi:hypothetical protein
MISPERLQLSRKRLKRGDRVFLARDPGESPYVLWLSTQERIAIPRTGVEKALPGSALVLYDRWGSPQTNPESLAAALRGVLQQMPRGENLWIPCPEEEPVLRCAAEQAHFQLRHVLRHADAFGTHQHADQSVIGVNGSLDSAAGGRASPPRALTP